MNIELRHLRYFVEIGEEGSRGVLVTSAMAQD